MLVTAALLTFLLALPRFAVIVVVLATREMLLTPVVPLTVTAEGWTEQPVRPWGSLAIATGSLLGRIVVEHFLQLLTRFLGFR